MKVSIMAKKVVLKDEIKELFNKKINKLSKFFNDDAEAIIKVSTQKDSQIVEATIYAAGMIYRAEDIGDDFCESIDKVVSSIERQIRKNKTRLTKKLRSTAFVSSEESFGDIEEDAEFNIIKTKRYNIKPMSVEEAILQMNLLDHEFFVFLNASTDETNIVYKRKNGDYGLIEAV